MLMRVLVAMGLAAALVAGAALALARTDFVSNNLCAYAVATIEEVSAAHVRLARCTVDPAQLQLRLDGLEVGREGERLHLTVARLFVRVVVRPLQQRLRLERLEVDHPQLELRLEERGPARKRGGECLPSILENFELGRVVVRKGRAEVRTAEGLRLSLPHLSARLQGDEKALQVKLLAKESDVELRGTGPDGTETVERGVSLLSARVAARVDLSGTGGVEVSKADLIGNELSAFVSGRIEDLCDPRIEANGNVRFDDLTLATERLIPGVLHGVKGSLSTDASLELRGRSLHLHGDLHGKGLTLEGLSPGELRASFDLTPERLEVEKLVIPMGPRGELGGKLRLGLTDTGVPFQADLGLRDLELAELLQRLGIARSHVVLKATGHVAAKGTLLPLQLEGEAGLDLADFAVLDRRFEQRAAAQKLLEFAHGHLATPLSIDRDQVKLPAAHLDVEGSRLDLDGTLFTDTTRGLDLRARAEGFSLDDFRGHLATIPIHGKVTLGARVQGPYTDPLIEADAEAKGLRFLDLSLGDVGAKVTFSQLRVLLDKLDGRKGRSVYQGRVGLDFNAEETAVDAHVELPDAYLHDLIDLGLGLVPTLRPVSNEQDVDGRVTGTIEAKGPASGPDGTAALAFEYVSLFGQTFADGDAHLTLHGSEPRLQLDSLVLRHGEARLSMAGRFGPRWELEMDAKTDQWDLGDLDSAKAAELQGPLTAWSRIRGVASHPVIDNEVRFTAGRAGKAVLGDGLFSMKIDGKAISWTGTAGPHTLRGSGALEGAFAYTSQLQLRFPDLSGLFQSFVPQAGLQSGSASADVAVSGSLLTWRESQVSMLLSQFRFSRGGIDFENDGPGQLSYGPEGLEVQRLDFRSSLLSLVLKGSRDADGQLDFHFSAAMDGRLLESQVPELEHAAGRYTLQGAVVGRSDNPSLLGNLRLEGGELRLRDSLLSQLSLRELSGSVTFSQDALVIDSMEGKINSGKARLSGRVAMKQLRPDRLDVALGLTDVPVKVQEGITASLDGDLTLSGPPLEPTLGGSLIVSRLRYAEDLDLERSLLAFNRRPITPRVLDKSQLLAHFDLDVHLSRGVRIDNNLARTELKGDLKVTGTSRALGMLGSINTVRGTAQFRGNEFQIDQGVLTFTDRQRIRPSFDFRANAQVKDYKVRLHAYGTPADPRLELTSEPTTPGAPLLSEADLGFLLTFGFVSTDLQHANFSAADSGLALGVEALNKVTGFSEEVRRIIPKNAILRDPNIDFVTDYTVAATGGSRLEPMARFRSHFVSDRLDLRMLEGLTTRRYRAQMSYQMTDSVSAQIQIDNEHVNVGTDLGADLKLRWEGE